MHLQQNWKNTIKRGFVTGWGHTVNQTFDLPTNQLTQSKRTIHTNKRCRLMFPNLDTKKFFCVGNVQERLVCLFISPIEQIIKYIFRKSIDTIKSKSKPKVGNERTIHHKRGRLLSQDKQIFKPRPVPSERLEKPCLAYFISSYVNP